MPLTARDVMQTSVYTVPPDTLLPDLERAFMERKVTGFPVVGEGGELLGIVSRSDVVRHLTVERAREEMLSDYYRDGGMGPVAPESLDSLGRAVGARVEHVPVRDVMMQAVVVAAPDDLVDEVARTLVEHHIHRIPVVDGRKLVGIVSSLDVVRLVAEGRR